MAKSILLMAGLTPLLLAGCVALEPLAPDAVRLEVGHESSALQHMRADPTDYGTQLAGVVIKWQRGHWVGKVSEEYQIGTCLICSGRDLFDARIGYEIPVPKP
jgi:hypothetical protein